MISSRDIVEITISIHAPTRGATPPLNIDDKCKDISIHAPTRGATSVSLWHGAALLFQSTLLQEEQL